MSAVLLVIHLLVAVALIVTVLLQRSEGGALGIGGGGAGSLFSSRGTANVLTRSTAVLAVAFFITSITLTILARQGGHSGSVFDRVPPTGTQQNAPGAPGSGSGGSALPRLPGAAPAQQSAPAVPAAPPAGPQVPTNE
jgi:preprotein translocase subunit SecG